MIDSDTIKIGLLGRTLKHSWSPLMHNRTLNRMGLNGIYLPLEVEEDKLAEAVRGLRALQFIGVNVTIPYKEKIMEYLDHVSDEARACGAVNLIKNQNGVLTGYNTDGKGFLAGLREEGVVPRGRVLFIGAGGAARAVAYELSQAGVEHMDFLDTNPARSHELAAFIGHYQRCATHGSIMNEADFAKLSQNADIIINCTPAGMFPDIDGCPVSSLEAVKAEAILIDLIYNPLYTRFLLLGQAKGLKTVSGLSMLVHQAALTLKILTGLEPPVEFMKEVLLNQYGVQDKN